jgi:hypothetical protein
VGFSATGSLLRSDFGMKTYIPVIGDEVTITIDAEFNHPANRQSRAGGGALIQW